ncbi:hypothetical protein D3C83_241770 [compost metagenome]
MTSRIQLNGHFFVFTDEAELQKLAKSVGKVRNARVYERAAAIVATQGIAAA